MVIQNNYQSITKENEMVSISDKNGEIIAVISEDKFPLNFRTERFTKAYQLILTQLKKLHLR